MSSLMIRPAQPEDAAAIAAIHTAAFGQSAEADLVARIRQSDGYLPELDLVAIALAKPVGHLLLSLAYLDGDRERPILALAPLGVRPAWQRQGIGTALGEAALERAQSRPEGAIVVLGHADFYARLGFVAAPAYQIECPFPVPPDVFRVYPLPSYHADRDRGTVIYPPAFTTVTPEAP